MTSVGEQIFLFGSPVDEPMPGLMEVLAYADLMLSGSLIFALVVLVGILGFYWEAVYPMAVWGANKLTQVTCGVASKAGWLLKELLSARSYGDLKAMIGKAEAILAMAISQSLVGRVVSGIIDFYFPGDCPAKTIIRMGSTFIAYMAADVFVFPFVSHCFTGICDAISVVVFDTRDYYPDMLPEIPHADIVSGVALCLLLLFVGAFWFFSETESSGPVSHKPSSASSPATPTEGNKAQEPAQPAANPTITSPSTSTNTSSSAAAAAASTSSSPSILLPLPTFRDMHSALTSCKSALRKEKATVKEAEQEIKRQCVEKEELRQALIQKDYQLRVARKNLKSTAVQQDGKVQVLKGEVARLNGDLDFQTEKTFRVERKVAELQARLEQPALDQALVSQAVLKEQSFEAENCAASGNSEREAYLMEQLELKSQTEDRLRSEFESLRAGMQREIEKIRVQYSQEALTSVNEAKQMLSTSEEIFQKQLHAATEDAKAKASLVKDLDDQIMWLKGQVLGEQSDKSDLVKEVKDLKEQIQELKETNLELELLVSAEPAQPAVSKPEPTAEEDQPILARLGAPNPQDVGHELMRQSAEALAAQQRVQFEHQIQEREATIKDLRSQVSDGQKHVQITTNNIERANKTIQDLNAELKACREQGASQQQDADDGKAAELSRQLGASREEAEANRLEAARAIEHIKMLEGQMREALMREAQMKAQMQAQTQPDDQKITPMKSSNRGSIATKLEQANVKIVTQGNTISDLRKRIAQLEAGQTQ